MTSVKYEYDVAISFLNKDEPLALAIREKLSPLRVFVYSKAQEQIAGREGDAAFAEVFREQSLVSLVLFRPGWGQSPFTRVEETAIRDHCFKTTWEHLMFVRLEAGTDTPTWVPIRYIYLDLQSFGMADLIGAINAKCISLGVEVKAASPAQLAADASAAERFTAETEALTNGSAQPLYDAAAILFTALESQLQAIEAGSGWAVERGAGPSPYGGQAFVAFLDPVSLELQTEWRHGEDRSSRVRVQLFEGRVLTPDQARQGFRLSRNPKRISNDSLLLTRSRAYGWSWRFREEDRSAEAVAEMLARDFIETRSRRRRTAGF